MRFITSTLLAAVLAVAAIGCSAETDGAATDPGTTDNEVSQGLGSQDASGDVTITEFSAPDSLDARTVMGEVVNNSSETSNYYIEANILDAQGTVIDWTNATVDNLQPGAKAVLRFVPVFDVPQGSTVELTEIQRTAAG